MHTERLDNFKSYLLSPEDDPPVRRKFGEFGFEYNIAYKTVLGEGGKTSVIAPDFGFEQPSDSKNANILNNNHVAKPLSIDISDILKSADFLDELYPDEKKYRRKVLEDKLYIPSFDGKVPAKVFTIDKIVNLQGSVGSGKSTLADCICVSILKLKEHKRILLIVDTIEDVLEKLKMFSKINSKEGSFCKAVPLVGKSSRRRYITRMQDKNMTIPAEASKLFESACFFDAMLDDAEGTIPYGEEPCTNLECRNDPSDKEKFVKKICPYYNFCSKTETDRLIESADVIITTLEGFFMSSFGPHNVNAYSYILNQFDLVIADECDAAFCRADNIFARSLNANERIQFAAGPVSKMNRRELNQKTNRAEDIFNEHLAAFSTVIDDLYRYRKTYREYGSKYDLTCVTSVGLLHQFKKFDPYESNSKKSEKYAIPEFIYNQLEHIVSNDIDSNISQLLRDEKEYFSDRVMFEENFRKYLHACNRKSNNKFTVDEKDLDSWIDNFTIPLWVKLHLPQFPTLV